MRVELFRDRGTWAVLVGALLGLVAGPGRTAAEPEGVTVERVEYGGWANNLKLSNGDVELIATLDVGPRIISYRLTDGINVFKQYDDQMGGAGEDAWMIRGGHRLWTSPEDPDRTYVLDNEPVEAETLDSGHVRLKPKPDPKHGLQKEIDLKLGPSGSRVRVTHRIRNVGSEPTELAIWALSVMAPGGVEVIPLPPKAPHPGGPENVQTAQEYAPHFHLVLWPYSDFTDPRWGLGRAYLTLRQDPQRGPTKIGLAHHMGWVAYLNQGTLFVKRFGYEEGQTYPDFGSNYETFTNEDMLELETLSPLVTLPPGEAVELTEQWELIAGVEDFASEDEIDRTIRARVETDGR